MVRVSTTYDKELNEKVFLVRGDEDYARTTDTVVTINTYTNSANSIEGYRIGLTINVLRAIGNSSVVVYDDEKVLGVYDWTGSTINIGDSSSGGFLLRYNVDHPIYVRFLGNSQCLPSKSKVQKLNYTLPSSFETGIAFQYTNQSISESGTYTSNITLTINGASSSYLYSTDIIIYVDGVYNSTITTPSDSNVKQLELSGLSKGLHTITAEVIESSTVHGASANTNVSVGYKVEFTEYPSTVYSDGNNTFKGKVDDYFGNTISTGNMALCNSSGTSLSSSSVSNNTATISYNNATDHTDNQAIYKLEYSGSYSNTVTMNYANLNGAITITSENIIGNGGVLPVTITLKDSLNNPLPNQYVDLTFQGGTIEELTNSNGQILFEYIGIGYGKFTLTATKDSLSTSKTITDYEQYWNLSSGEVETAYNKSYATDHNQILNTSQGYYTSNSLITFPNNTTTEYRKMALILDCKSSSMIYFYDGSSYDPYHYVEVKNNDTLKMSYSKNSSTNISLTVYVNESVAYTTTFTNYSSNKIGFITDGFYFNNLRIIPMEHM